MLAGEERHESIDLALRHLGLGAPVVVPADGQGRLRQDTLAQTLAHGDGPVMVRLQVGNVHWGAFDPVAAATALAHQHGAWVHADGAFGLWAAAPPSIPGPPTPQDPQRALRLRHHDHRPPGRGPRCDAHPRHLSNPRVQERLFRPALRHASRLEPAHRDAPPHRPSNRCVRLGKCRRPSAAWIPGRTCGSASFRLGS